MEHYNSEYLLHNFPLMFLGGLGHGYNPKDIELPSEVKGTEIKILCKTSVTNPLSLAILKSFIGKQEESLWESEVVRGSTQTRSFFRVITVGDTWYLPPRTADMNVADNSSKTPHAHSPISPLTPGYKLYPDGIISPDWIKKYRNCLPSVFVICYELVDFNDDQLARETDNNLAQELNDIRRKLNERKIKLIVIITSMKSSLGTSNVSDRLVYLEKSSGLDSKSMYFIPPSSSDVEIKDLAMSIKKICYPIALEFYSGIIKKIRKKKRRGVVGQSLVTPTIPPLSHAGWAIRYDFKIGIFSEIRQEFDIAVKAYETVYESIIELFDTIALYSTRWNEARELLDIVVFRIFRCYLYLNHSNTSQKKFNIHVNAVKILLKNSSAFSDSYSFAAWLAIQHILIAQLLELVPVSIIPVELPYLSSSLLDESPNDYLHHSGFHYFRAVTLIKERRYLASKPNAAKSRNTYLVPKFEDECKYDYDGEILSLCDRAYSRFPNDYIHFRCAIQFEKAEAYFLKGDLKSAFSLYTRIFSFYKVEPFPEILTQILTRLCEISRLLHEEEEFVNAYTLLLSSSIPCKEVNKRIFDEHLEKISKVTPIKAILTESSLPSLFSVSLLFGSHQDFVGNKLPVQITISFLMKNTITNFQIASLEIEIGDSFPIIKLINNNKKSEKRLHKLTKNIIEENSNEISISEFPFPIDFSSHDSITFQLSILPRTVSILKPQTAKITLKKNLIEVLLNTNLYKEISLIPSWLILKNKKYIKVMRNTSHEANIVAKPANIDMHIHSEENLYSSEKIMTTVEIQNQEANSIKGKLTAKIIIKQSNDKLAENVKTVDFLWESKEGIINGEKNISLKASENKKFFLTFIAPIDMCDLEMQLDCKYYVTNDELTLMEKSCSTIFSVSSPFRVSYTFNPCVNEEPWKNFFVMDKDDTEVNSFSRKWCLGASIASLPGDDIEVSNYSLSLMELNEINCTACPFEKKTPILMSSGDIRFFDFFLIAKSLGNQEKRSGSLSAILDVEWKRKIESSISTSLFKFPPLKLQLPLSEPRVLLDIISRENDILHIRYIIENPSNYILQFSVNVDSSEAFAFTGIKKTSVRVLPYSKRNLDYYLTPFFYGKLRLPLVKIHDIQFNKTLVVLPANRQLRTERNGNIFISLDPL